MKTTNNFLLCLLVTTVFSSEFLIYEGQKAKAQTFIHSAYLQIRCDDKVESFFSCGSSIINHRLLLSAAHCVHGCRKLTAIIKLGSVNYLEGMTNSLSKYKIHEYFVRRRLENDISLILTKETIVFGNGAGRVALLKQPPTTPAHVAGWGQTGDSPKTKSKKLWYAAQQIMKDKDCIDILLEKPCGTVCSRPTIKGYPNNGDSGNALVVKDYIQVGIVSYNCPPKDSSITVNTYIPHFVDWIKSTSKNMYCE